MAIAPSNNLLTALSQLQGNKPAAAPPPPGVFAAQLPGGLGRIEAPAPASRQGSSQGSSQSSAPQAQAPAAEAPRAAPRGKFLGQYVNIIV